MAPVTSGAHGATAPGALPLQPPGVARLARQVAIAPVLHGGGHAESVSVRIPPLCAHGGPCLLAVSRRMARATHAIVAGALLLRCLLAGRRGVPVTAAHAADVRDDLRHGEVVLLEARVAGRVVARLVQELLRHVAVHALGGLSRAAQRQSQQPAQGSGCTYERLAGRHTANTTKPGSLTHTALLLSGMHSRACLHAHAGAAAVQPREKLRRSMHVCLRRLHPVGVPRRRAAPARRSAGGRRCRA